MSYDENCPICSKPCVGRERHMNGYSFCVDGHKWKTGNDQFMKSFGIQTHIEGLELRIAELIVERNQYDERRRDAMEKVEEYRAKYQELLKGGTNNG